VDRSRTLDRAVARSGAGSRSQAQAWIAAGRVRVNGLLVRDPATWIDPRSDAITLDGQPLRSAERVHLALHKPLGYLTTRSDPRGRPTVFDLLDADRGWIAPVGRLDVNTSGLLLFTNDSDLADRITDPRGHLPKTYHVTAQGALDEEQLERLRRGVELDDGPTLPAEVRRLPSPDKRARIELVLREGRNRQVRRMLREVGSVVVALERVAIGPLKLGDLASGASRPLSSHELRRLRSALGDPPARLSPKRRRPRA
jgi:23S rRNA pseudouridine2605 synthase